MPSVSKGISQSKKQIRTLRKISPLTFSMLTYLVRINPLNRAKSARKIKIIKEVSRAAEDENRVTAMTSLPKISTLFLKKKKKTFLKLSTSTISGKVITLSSISKKKI